MNTKAPSHKGGASCPSSLVTANGHMGSAVLELLILTFKKSEILILTETLLIFKFGK